MHYTFFKGPINIYYLYLKNYIPQLAVNLGYYYAQGSELPKIGFLLAQRYTNLAWGKGDDPKGSELTKTVCNYSCQQKLLQC